MLKLCNLRRSHAHRLYSLLLIRPLQEKSEKICPESYAEIAKDPRKNARAELGVLGRRAAWENAKKPAIPTDKGAVGGKFAPTGHSRTTIQLSLRWSLFFNHTDFEIDNHK